MKFFTWYQRVSLKSGQGAVSRNAFSYRDVTEQHFYLRKIFQGTTLGKKSISSIALDFCRAQGEYVTINHSRRDPASAPPYLILPTLVPVWEYISLYRSLLSSPRYTYMYKLSNITYFLSTINSLNNFS